MDLLTNLQKEELYVFEDLIESKRLHDRLVALFMINVTKTNGFNDLRHIANYHLAKIPHIEQVLKANGMEQEAESLRVLAALFEVMSVDGVLTDRITTEQNRKAQNERHNRTKKELIPLMDKIVHSIEHPISVALGADLFISSYPDIERPHSSLQKLFKERRDILGYPALSRGRPARNKDI